MQATSQSLHDKRTNLLPLEKQGPNPTEKLTTEEHPKNKLPDILVRWNTLHQPNGISRGYCSGFHSASAGANAHRLMSRGKGFGDSLLWGDNGKPPGPVEARQSKRSPQEREQ